MMNGCRISEKKNSTLPHYREQISRFISTTTSARIDLRRVKWIGPCYDLYIDVPPKTHALTDGALQSYVDLGHVILLELRVCVVLNKSTELS